MFPTLLISTTIRTSFIRFELRVQKHIPMKDYNKKQLISTALSFLFEVECVNAVLVLPLKHFVPQIHVTFVVQFALFDLEILTIFPLQTFVVSPAHIWPLVLEVSVFFIYLILEVCSVPVCPYAIEVSSIFVIHNLPVSSQISLYLKYLWSSDYCCLHCSHLTLSSCTCRNICSSVSHCLLHRFVRA